MPGAEEGFFTQGAMPGGVLSRDELHRLLLWLSAHTVLPLTLAALETACAEAGLANYFEASAAVDWLLEQKFLQSKQSEGDLILQPGENTQILLEQAEKTVAAHLRKRALQAAEEALEFENRERGQMCSVIPLEEGGCYVTFRQGSNSRTLLRITLYCADLAQAEAAKKSFLRNPALLFAAVLESMSGE
jgi:hypothetical protein